MKVIDVNTLPQITVSIEYQDEGSISYKVTGQYNDIVFDEVLCVPTGHAACFDVVEKILYTRKIDLNNQDDIILAI